MGHSEADRRHVHDAIVGHLQANPAASDTPEGIRQWWLDVRSRAADLDLVTDVLNALVLEGVMKRRQLPDGGVVYSGATG